jgi:monoamine oxidase
LNIFIGTAGLYCGILLAEAGHTVTIFEASDRAGGRIQTYRDPKNTSKYIGELGAMRFPLDNHPYVNSLIRQRYKMNITEFSNFNENVYTYINGIFAIKKQAHNYSDMFQFNTSQNEREKVRRCCLYFTR